MRAARIGADGVLRDGDGFSVRRPPMMSNARRFNPAVRYLGQEPGVAPSITIPASAPTTAVAPGAGLSVARKYGVPAKDFCYTDRVGNPKKQIYPSRLVYLNNPSDDSLYVVSFRVPADIGKVKLYKVEGTLGSGRWYEIPIKGRIAQGDSVTPSLLEDFYVVPFEAAQMVWACAGKPIPMLDDSQESLGPDDTFKRLNHSWISTLLMSAEDVMLDIPAIPSSIAVEDLCQHVIMAHYLASVAIDYASAAYDTLAIGIKALALYKKVGYEIARFAVKVRNLILPAIEDPSKLPAAAEEVVKYRDEFGKRTLLYSAYSYRAGLYTMWSFAIDNGGVFADAARDIYRVYSWMDSTLASGPNRDEVVKRGIASPEEIELLRKISSEAVKSYEDGSPRYENALENHLASMGIRRNDLGELAFIMPIIFKENRERIKEIQNILRRIGPSEPRETPVCLGAEAAAALSVTEALSMAASATIDGKRAELVKSVVKLVERPAELIKNWPQVQKTFYEVWYKGIRKPIEKIINLRISEGTKMFDKILGTRGWEGFTSIEAISKEIIDLDRKKNDKKLDMAARDAAANKLKSLENTTSSDFYHKIQAYLKINTLFSEAKAAGPEERFKKYLEIVLDTESYAFFRDPTTGLKVPEIGAFADLIAFVDTYPGERAGEAAQAIIAAGFRDVVPARTWYDLIETLVGREEGKRNIETVIDEIRKRRDEARALLGGIEETVGVISPPKLAEVKSLSEADAKDPAKVDAYWKTKCPGATTTKKVDSATGAEIVVFPTGKDIQGRYDEMVRMTLLYDKLVEGQRSGKPEEKPSERVQGMPIAIPDLTGPIWEPSGEIPKWLTEIPWPPETSGNVTLTMFNRVIVALRYAESCFRPGKEPQKEVREGAPSIDTFVYSPGDPKAGIPPRLEGGTMLERALRAMSKTEMKQGAGMDSAAGAELLAKASSSAQVVRSQMEELMRQTGTITEGVWTPNYDAFVKVKGEETPGQAIERQWVVVNAAKALESTDGPIAKAKVDIGTALKYSDSIFTTAKAKILWGKIKAVFMMIINVSPKSLEMAVLKDLHGIVGPWTVLVGAPYWAALAAKMLAILAFFSFLPGVLLVKTFFYRSIGTVVGMLPAERDVSNNQVSPSLGAEPGIWTFVLFALGIGAIFYGRNFFGAIEEVVGGFFKFGAALAPGALKRKGGVIRTPGGKRRGPRVIVEDWLKNREAAMYRLEKATSERAKEAAQRDLNRALDKLRKAKEEGEDVPPGIVDGLWGFNWLG